MTLANLRDLLTDLQQLDLDNIAGAAPSSASLDSQINRALRWIADQTLCCYDDAVVLTLTASVRRYSIQDLAIMSRTMIDVDGVVVNGRRLNKPDGNPGLWPLAEFRRDIPNYLSSSAGQPLYGAMQDDYHLILYPSPTQAVVDAGSSYVSGHYLPATMAQDGNAPDLPVQYHEHIAYVAAVQSSTPLASEAEVWQRLQAFNASIAGDLVKLRSRSANRGVPRNRASSSEWFSPVVEI